MNDWILDLGADLRGEISRRPWRSKINGDDLAWVHQLAWQSVEFTQALGLQWALSNSHMTRDLHADHAADEARHPEQLRRWMDAQLLTVETPFLSVPPTKATIVLMAFNMRVVVRERFAVRVGVLNVLGEGVALDAFTAMIDVLGPTGRLDGESKFWRIHKTKDGDHMRIGVAELGHLRESSLDGRDMTRMMRIGAELYGDMLDSWFQT